MRTVRQDVFELIFSQVLNIFLSRELERIFLSASSGKIAMAALLLHHRKRDPRGMQDFDHGTSYLLSSPVVGRRATNPVEIIHGFPFCGNRNI